MQPGSVESVAVLPCCTRNDQVAEVRWMMTPVMPSVIDCQQSQRPSGRSRHAGAASRGTCRSLVVRGALGHTAADTGHKIVFGSFPQRPPADRVEALWTGCPGAARKVAHQPLPALWL